MTIMLRSFVLACALLAAANAAHAAVTPALDGAKGTSTAGFGSFTGDSATLDFTFDLASSAKSDVVLQLISPGAFGAAISSASAALARPSGDTTLGTLGFQPLLIAASLFQSIGTHTLTIAAGADHALNGTTKTFEFSLAVTPLPGTLPLVALALAGLGLVRTRARLQKRQATPAAPKTI